MEEGSSNSFLFSKKTMQKNTIYFEQTKGETNSLPADAILMILQRTGFPIDDDSGKVNG